jgi:co-chaperonin GroES (HSP10)
MKFIPDNRHLLVQPIEEREKEENSFKILTPDDYKEPESPYVVCEVLNIADTCNTPHVSIGDEIVVERRMLHKIELSGKTFYLVLENYIYGRLYR